ncbi:2-oxoglutarate and iron-dependent oxygenase domain-containing protein, partial [Vibrio parahaemolyticus]
IGDVVREIGAACRDIGFFYVVAHGVPDTLMRETFAMARDFFSLPEAQKSKASILASRHNRGYVAMQGERLDP